MIRKFNYTGRERILREDVRILLKEEEGLRTFDASIDLDAYELPGSALVAVEAYRSGSPTWMRFPFGNAAKVEAPADRMLTEFDSFDGIKFRVRVTSVEEPSGLLLAEADRITLKKPEEEKENRVSLLPVVPEDLGEQLWRVDFEEEPSLLVNKAVGDWRAVSLSPGFVALVYPAVLREVLTRTLLFEKHFDLDDSEEPLSKWLRFASLLPGMTELPTEDEGAEASHDWIENAVAAFARRCGLLAKFDTFWKETTK